MTMSAERESRPSQVPAGVVTASTGRESAARLDFMVLQRACIVVRLSISLDPPWAWAWAWAWA